jgi:hypothetical protein
MPRGGKREGAGRPAGGAWKPATVALRAASVEKMKAIVNGDQDPLTVVTAMVLDETLDIGTRLHAANTVLPFRVIALQKRARRLVR